MEFTQIYKTSFTLPNKLEMQKGVARAKFATGDQ
jgi:hypothetical protein